MNNHSTEIIQELSIKELFESEDRYTIPIYQRNYAWGEKEITQLIQDITDYQEMSDQNQSYYLGSLVVFKRKEDDKYIYETIDGQQRLTTLFILLNALKRNKPELFNDWFKASNLTFDSRQNSTNTLQAISNNNLHQNAEYNNAIKEAFEKVTQLLGNKRKNYESFIEFLLNKVKILRVLVPDDTDLNHYFEIMNNRGEQLEKHEILKAKMLDVLKKEEHSASVFNAIWEACSDMERYVQYGFKVENRIKIFGSDWNSIISNNFDDLCNSFKKIDNIQNNKYDIDSIIKGVAGMKDINQEKEDTPDRFNSVINFQNFLLHVLRVQTEQDIPLDDKRLIDSFKTHMERKDVDSLKFVKEFAFNLLKCRFLFDKYIIKREYLGDKDNWSLKRLVVYKDNKIGYINSFEKDEQNEKDGKNRVVLMLLAMFHVSTPTLVYKHWLNAAIYYLFQKSLQANKLQISIDNYISYLESIAKAFVFDRFLSTSPKEYYDIIYKEKHPKNPANQTINKQNLTYYHIENNLIFNYLDYLLWKTNKEFYSFEFTFRSSVEHYYPQHPIDGNRNISDPKILHSFGNLCLISHSKNSRLSNFMPLAKKDFFTKDKPYDSLKLSLMMNYKKWEENEILEHGQKMIQILENELKK